MQKSLEVSGDYDKDRRRKKLQRDRKFRKQDKKAPKVRRVKKYSSRDIERIIWDEEDFFGWD